MSPDKVKKNVVLSEISKWTKNFFFSLIFGSVCLKTWISRRVSYFVGILYGVRDIFLLACP